MLISREKDSLCQHRKHKLIIDECPESLRDRMAAHAKPGFFTESAGPNACFRLSFPGFEQSECDRELSM
jgi:hypothetical protein